MDASASGELDAGPCGLVISGTPDRAVWDAFGETTIRRAASTQLWVVGDWINYGERVWGQTYERAEKLTGLEYGTLANAASVARKFDRSRRREKLPFGHHVEVASLAPARADELLLRAEREGLSRCQLRALVRGDRSRLVVDERTERVAAAIRAATNLKQLVGDLLPDALRIELEHVLDALNRLATDPVVTEADRATDEDLTAGRVGRRI